jgi:diguanylate cyclase (GGDEF)-like protein
MSTSSEKSLQRLGDEDTSDVSSDAAVAYIRDKIDQLLLIMGTLPLKPEELDDDTLLELDPIGIIANSFAQILEHQRETNSELTLARDEVKAIVDSAGAAIIVVDEKMRVETCNQRSMELFFPGMRGVEGQLLCELLCDPANPVETRMFQAIANEGSEGESEDIVHHEAYYRLVATPVRDQEERVMRVIYLYADISEQKRIQDSLRRSERRYHSLYSTMREGVAIHLPIDKDDYRVMEVNHSFHELFDDRAPLIGRRTRELYGSAAELCREVFSRVRQSGEAEGFDMPDEATGRVFRVSVFAPGNDQVAAIFDDVTERKQAEQQIEQLAYFDPLTGLPNRALLFHRLSEATAYAKRQDQQMAVLFVDLDGFKPINDSLGHAVGDTMLKEVAKRLRECVRESDTVARLGGDEFLVLLPSVRRYMDITRVADGLLDTISEPFDLEHREICISASIGIALFPSDSESAPDLIRDADIAMYAAKKKQRGSYQFFSESLNSQVQERVELESWLRKALKNDEFHLRYQPQVDMRSGRIVGAEALLRWNSPEHGSIPPDRFVPVAEESGLIVALGEWVLRNACAQMKVWLDAGLPLQQMSVNLAGPQIQHSNLVSVVQDALAESGLRGEQLELEITENFIMREAESTVEVLQALQSMGVGLAIDDFGTGRSSLSYLKRLPVNRLKVDREFVRDIPQDSNDIAITQAIIALGRALQIEVVAEGVETEEQRDFLLATDCIIAQGFLYAQPLLPEELEALI